MRYFFLLLCLYGIVPAAVAQTDLITEDFNYNPGNLVGQGSWSQVGTNATNPIQVVTPSAALTFPGYSSAGGNAIALTAGSTAGQFAYKNLATVHNSGSVYSSFLVRVSAAQGTGAYFMNFTNLPNTANNNFGLVYTRAAGPGFQFGVGKSRTAAATYSGDILPFNTTYLVVVKYFINPGALNNDSVTLYVFNNSIPAAEPATASIGPVGFASPLSDADSLTSITLRQSNAGAPTLQLDALKVSTSWPGSAPLPLKLLSFTAAPGALVTELRWSTAAERDLEAFEVERSTDGSHYKPVCTVLPRNSGSDHAHYTATDPSPVAGLSYYRLKISERLGAPSYSGVVRVQSATYTELSLSPNPAGDGLITMKHPAASEARILILDAQGKILKTLVPGAGATQTAFSLEALPAGLYQAVYLDGALRKTLPVLKK